MNKFEGKFLLPHFYGVIQWLEALIVLVEEMISVLSVPLLSFGVVVSMIDFFQGGALSHDANFSLAWAIIQAVSLDAQVAFTWHKARRASAKGKTFAFFGFLFIGVMLAFVVWASSSLEGQHQIANNSGPQEPLVITTVSHPEEWPYGYNPSIYAPPPNIPVFPTTPEVDNTSVSLLGVSVPSNLLVSIRMGIAVVLLCIAGWTRKLIAEMDTVATKEATQKPTKRERKPFWLVQKWLQIRTWWWLKQATKTATKEDTNQPENEPQKSHYPDTGELEKTATTATDILATTEPQTNPNLATQKATAKVTKKLNVEDAPTTEKATQTSRSKVVKLGNSKRDKAMRIVRRNRNITPSELAEKADISLSYAKQILSEQTA